VVERVELYEAHKADFEEQVKRCSTVHGNLVVLDLRNEEVIHPGSRFAIYAMFPECNISIHQMWGLKKVVVMQLQELVRWLWKKLTMRWLRSFPKLMKSMHQA